MNDLVENEAMGEAFRSAANQTREQQLAQIETALDHFRAQGFDKLDGPILQLVRATTLPGKRQDMLDTLSKFEPYAQDEVGTLFYGHFADMNDPDVVHSMQVYEDWDALCVHMRKLDYFQFVDPIMAVAAPGSPTYYYGKNLFYFRGKGKGKKDI